jgi:hypothetical protein
MTQALIGTGAEISAETSDTRFGAWVKRMPNTMAHPSASFANLPTIDRSFIRLFSFKFFKTHQDLGND